MLTLPDIPPLDEEAMRAASLSSSGIWSKNCL